MKPKLLVEKLIDKEITIAEIPVRFPHCDPLILHLPELCVYCKESDFLQNERIRLNVSNTGKNNRAWPCPADKARSSESQNRWNGNRPQTQEDLDNEKAVWDEFTEKLKEQESK